VDHVTKLKDQRIIMTRGVLEPHKPDIQVQMTNFMDEPVTIYTNEQIGTCESYHEQEVPHWYMSKYTVGKWGAFVQNNMDMHL
jgi:hypothetical protein